MGERRSLPGRRNFRKWVVVVRWYLLRRDLRGSGAAIIAFLGDHEAPHLFEGASKVGSLEHSDVTVYFKAGDERYQLCPRDLERLHEMGYVYREEHQYRYRALDACCWRGMTTPGFWRRG